MTSQQSPLTDPHRYRRGLSDIMYKLSQCGTAHQNTCSRNLSNKRLVWDDDNSFTFLSRYFRKDRSLPQDDINYILKRSSGVGSCDSSFWEYFIHHFVNKIILINNYNTILSTLEIQSQSKISVVTSQSKISGSSLHSHTRRPPSGEDSILPPPPWRAALSPSWVSPCIRS